MSVDSDRSKAAVAVRGQSTPACPSRRDSADEGGLLSSLLFFSPLEFFINLFQTSRRFTCRSFNIISNR